MAKLLITRCKVRSGGQVSELSGPADKFETAINPASLKLSGSIAYSGVDSAEDAIGAPGATPRFRSTGAMNLGFQIVLDGTGVVPLREGDKSRTVAEQLAALKDIVYEYNGEWHEPSVVKVSWGNRGMAPYFGRLTSLDVEYTLFRPSGEALRAKVSLSFISYATQKELQLIANTSSPDLTHLVTVIAGDTLPLLCDRIYQDASLYREVAKRNGLDGFRVTPGMELVFPPMR